MALMAVLCNRPLRAEAAGSAVVFVYHRFGEDSHPGASIRLDQFDAHLAELAGHGYVVRPLSAIVADLAEGRPLADRTIALTIDNAYRSVLTEAWPRLKRAGLPVTLFVAADIIDRGSDQYMSWDQLRGLVAEGVEIGVLNAGYDDMTQASDDENMARINRAIGRVREELGITPRLFAYPYGAWGAAARALVRPRFAAALGQHSGAIGPGADLWSLPRFPMTEAYGGIDRFRLAANALPIPAADLTPDDMKLGENPPVIGFTVTDPGFASAGLSCFASEVGRLDTTLLPPDRVEVRSANPFPPGRTRVNCTAPGEAEVEGEKRWYWLGLMLSVPGGD